MLILLLFLYPCCVQHAGIRSGRDTRRLSMRIACCILLFFMALRASTVGTDTKYYCYVFRQFADIPWNQVFSAVTFGTESQTWSFDFEPGYRLYNKILSCFCTDSQTITIANSILVIVFLYKWLERDSQPGLLSIWLYLTLGLFQTHMNTTRNAIAIFIVYLAIPYVQRKQFWRYCCLVLLSGSFHRAALVFLPLYWLMQRPIKTLGQVFLLILAAAAVGMNFDFLRPFVTSVLPDSLAKYFYKENLKPEMLMVGLLYLGLIVVIFILMNPEERRSAICKHPIGLWMFALNQICFGLNLGVNAAARMAALFGPYIVLFIPQLIACIEAPKRRRQVAGCVILGCGAQYLLRMLINNIGGSMPYIFFFNT